MVFTLLIHSRRDLCVCVVFKYRTGQSIVARHHHYDSGIIFSNGVHVSLVCSHKSRVTGGVSSITLLTSANCCNTFPTYPLLLSLFDDKVFIHPNNTWDTQFAT